MIFKHKNILSSLAQTDENLSQEQIQGGMHWLNIHGVTAQSMTALQGGGPFLIAFVLSLGASNYEIGLIAALAFIGEFMQIPGLYLLHIFKKRRAIAFITGLIYRLLWALIILTPFLFAFLVRLVSISLIGQIKEQGDVTEKEIITQLFAEISGPIRMVSSIPGIRHLVDLPFSSMNWKNGRKQIG